MAKTASANRSLRDPDTDAGDSRAAPVGSWTGEFEYASTAPAATGPPQSPDGFAPDHSRVTARSRRTELRPLDPSFQGPTGIRDRRRGVQSRSGKVGQGPILAALPHLPILHGGSRLVRAGILVLRSRTAIAVTQPSPPHRRERSGPVVHRAGAEGRITTRAAAARVSTRRVGFPGTRALNTGTS